MLLCIGSYHLCKMMGLQVISMGGSLTETEATEEVLLLGEVLVLGEVLHPEEVVLNPHGDGMGTKTLMTTTLVIDLGEVVEILKVATAGLAQQEKAVGMIGSLEVDDQAGLHHQTG